MAEQITHEYTHNVIQGDPKKRAPILIILNTRGPFFLGHPVHLIILVIMMLS